ncbi:MAG: hypothetical protein GY832_23765 [Chloroflexi bacterium]|nr:hypothetical protein [Chloroflexota bacterium]
MAEVQDAIKELQKRFGGSDVGGVELVGAGRAHGGTNEEVIDGLADGGRDYKTLHDANRALVSQAFVDEMNRRLEKMFKKINRAVNRQAGLTPTGKISKRPLPRIKRNSAQIIQGAIDEANSASYRACMRKYQEIVSNYLSTNHTASGPAKPVSQNDGGAYARWRQRKFGVPPSEVGRASGQLLANINNPATIRVTKRK